VPAGEADLGPDLAQLADEHHALEPGGSGTAGWWRRAKNFASVSSSVGPSPLFSNGTSCTYANSACRSGWRQRRLVAPDRLERGPDRVEILAGKSLGPVAHLDEARQHFASCSTSMGRFFADAAFRPRRRVGDRERALGSGAKYVLDDVRTRMLGVASQPRSGTSTCAPATARAPDT